LKAQEPEKDLIRELKKANSWQVCAFPSIAQGSGARTIV